MDSAVLDPALGQTLCGIWLRPCETSRPVAASRAEADAGGLQNDCHWDPTSPRQVLLAGADTYRDLALPKNALRENLLMSGRLEFPSGTILQVGSSVQIQITFDCEPCGRLNAHAKDLSRIIAGRRGLLAKVIRGGSLNVGDRLGVIGIDTHQQWPERWQDRIRMVAARLPEGLVVDYADLARFAGVPVRLCRAFPRLLATAGIRGAVRAGTHPELRRWDGIDVVADTNRAKSNRSISMNSKPTEALQKALQDQAVTSQKISFGSTTVHMSKGSNKRTAMKEPPTYPKCSVPSDLDTWLS